VGCRGWVVMQSASGGRLANREQGSEAWKGAVEMGDFPVAAGFWTERMVRREGGGLGSKNGSSVEEEDGQGELQTREKEGRVSRAHGVAPTLWGRVDVWRGSQQNEIS
jgi:hypothetical protein